MIQLSNLLEGIRFEVFGNQDRMDFRPAAIVFDSRQADKHTLFVAIQGATLDGHDYIPAAIAAGTKCIVGEHFDKIQKDITYIRVEDSRLALGLIAANFYEQPSKSVQLIGVTGTNGKTSTATLLYRLFMGLEQKAGLISTVENRIGTTIIPATHTTPDAVSLQRMMAAMRDAGCEYVFMEVSSHAIDQDRIAGLHFDLAIFTNISHDHLDYHGSFQNYIYAKKKFFDRLSKSAHALVNIDDKRGAVMVQNTLAEVHTYALKNLADYKLRILENSLSGLVLQIDGREVYTRLVGDFNAYNLLAVYAAARILEEDPDESLRVLSQLKTAEGRFDYVSVAGMEITGIVDYAHTPDALEKVLTTLQKVRRGNEQIITVVGCGGDRDRTKRPMMAKIACKYSEQVILTSDNPRTEDPNAILNEMEEGIPASANMKVLRIADRKQAIKTACKLAKTGDIVLVAGKGHEKYQEINGVKHPFDDKELLETLLTKNLKT